MFTEEEKRRRRNEASRRWYQTHKKNALSPKKKTAKKTEKAKNEKPEEFDEVPIDSFEIENVRAEDQDGSGQGLDDSAGRYSSDEDEEEREDGCDADEEDEVDPGSEEDYIRGRGEMWGSYEENDLEEGDY